MSVYTSVLRPLLFRLGSERAHELAKTALRRRWLWTPLTSRYRVDDPRLRVDFGGVELANPVGLSAGFDKNSEMLDAWQAFGFGYAVVGSIRGVPAPDNPAPRILRYPEHGRAPGREAGAVDERQNDGFIRALGEALDEIPSGPGAIQPGFR
jgi:hypothetical protein